MEGITAIPDGLSDAATGVFVVFLVAGSVGVMRRARILDSGSPGSPPPPRRVELLIPALTFAFAAVSVVGMPELSIAYLPIVQPLLCSPGLRDRHRKWIRFYLPRFAIVLVLAIGGLVVAQRIALGPF